MDYKTIEDEIDNFSTTYFANLANYAESNLIFIKSNNLLILKYNYTVLIDYLNKTLTTFETLDKQFLNSILKKLITDINQLCKLYNQTKENKLNTLNLFETKFINQNPTLNTYSKIIIDKSMAIETTNPQHLQHLKQKFSDLREIYFQIFQKVIFKKRQKLLHSLKDSINTKAYYLDKILWSNAKKSFRIINYLEIKNLKDNFNSKNYIKTICSLMRPCTEEYNYLQSCLKVYR